MHLLTCPFCNKHVMIVTCRNRVYGDYYQLKHTCDSGIIICITKDSEEEIAHVWNYRPETEQLRTKTK